MDLSATASLAIATLNLLEVQDVIGAIRAADAESAGKSNPLTPLPSIAPRPVIHPEPVYNARLVFIDSAPRPKTLGYICCPQPAPIDRPRLALEGPDRVDVCASSRQSNAPANSVQAPWAQRVWEMPIAPRPQIKVIKYHTDILSKGSLIDMFI